MTAKKKSTKTSKKKSKSTKVKDYSISLDESNGKVIAQS